MVHYYCLLGGLMKTSKRLIGARIKSLRETKKMTQERLAEKIAINTVYLRNIERGMANPPLDMLIRISDALEADMWELFDCRHEVSHKKLRKMLRNSQMSLMKINLKMLSESLKCLQDEINKYW